MILATFFKKKGLYYSFSISGHSGYASVGNDIVCAGVSSAAEMTVNAIIDILKEPCNISINENTAQISLSLKSIKNETASLFIQSLHSQLDNISEQYPKYVKVKLDKRE